MVHLFVLSRIVPTVKTPDMPTPLSYRANMCLNIQQFCVAEMGAVN